MLLGVILHASASFVVYPIEALWPYKFEITHQYFDATLTIIHLFRIPVFYIIAGYFMALLLHKYGLKEVIRKRIKRIVIPFLLGMLFLAPVVTFGFYVLITDVQNITNATIRDYLSIYYLNTVHFWFLYYLIFFYGVHLVGWQWRRPILQGLKIKNSSFYWSVFLFQTLLLIILGNDSIHGDYSMVPPLGSVLYFMSYYVMGIWIYGHFEYFLRLTQFSVKTTLLAIFFTTVYLIFRDKEALLGAAYYWQVLESFLTIFAAASLVLTVFGVFTHLFAQPQKWIDLVAKSSYTIYMVHLPILVWLIYFLKDKMNNAFVFYSLLIILTTGLSYLVFWLREFKR